MKTNLGKKMVFLSLEYLGAFAGIWAFLIFFKALSSKILGEILSAEHAITTPLQIFFWDKMGYYLSFYYNSRLFYQKNQIWVGLKGFGFQTP